MLKTGSMVPMAINSCINDTGRVHLQLQDGTILDGVQHSDWKSGVKGEMMLCVLDLSNAYKQLPLSPSCRKYSIVTFGNPNTGEPACFEGKVLPFLMPTAFAAWSRRDKTL